MRSKWDLKRNLYVLLQTSVSGRPPRTEGRDFYGHVLVSLVLVGTPRVSGLDRGSSSEVSPVGTTRRPTPETGTRQWTQG